MRSRAALAPERRKDLETVIADKKVCDMARANLAEARDAHKDSTKLHDAYLALRRKLFPPQNQIDALRDVIVASSQFRPWRRGDPRKDTE